MKVGINARLLLHNKLEGIGWFTFQILSRIVQKHPEVHFYFFFDRPYHDDFIFGKNVTPVVLGPQARHPLLYYIWFDFKIAPYLKKEKIDVFFSPEGFSANRSSVPSVITIHDLAYMHFPKQIDAANLWFYKNFQPKFAQKSKAIITVSEYTKKDIAQKYAIPEEKISVVYNAANPAYGVLTDEEKQAVKEKYSKGKSYFLFVGALHPRKNIINMLKGFVQFKRRQQCGLKLLIVGRMAWKTEEIEEAKNRMPYRDEVEWLGYKDVDELKNIVGGAYALLYPSLFEGFGIPIVEAMACGVPSIVSNTSSMPEVAGSAALICDPNDPKDIAEQLGLMYKDEALHQKLSENCFTEIKRFNWDRSAEQVWQIISATASAHSKNKNK